MTPPPRLVCIPTHDALFTAAANRLAATIPDELGAEDALQWFAYELRRAYPTATVRQQHDLARADRNEVVWYATLRGEQFRIDFTVAVPVAPAAAFDIYVRRVIEWQSAVELAPRHLVPEIVGSEYDATYTFLGRRFQGILRVTAADPPNRVSLEAEGSGIVVAYTTRFEPDAQGTLVRVLGDYTLPDHVLARVLDRLGLERAIGRDIQRANDAYRRLCEEAAGGGPQAGGPSRGGREFTGGARP